MAQNKVQYQRGLSMPEFFGRYATGQQCEELVRAWRWPDGFCCPRCQGSWHSEFRRQDRLYFQCSGCRYQCSLVSGTVFESSKVPLPSWFLAMHLMTQAKNNVSALELKQHLGVSYPTAWLLKHKIMQVMTLREQDRQLTGRVEIDDAYLGGEVQGGKVGRGSPNKIPFVAAVQTTESGQPALICLSQRPFTKASIQAFAEQSLAAPASTRRSSRSRIARSWGGASGTMPPAWSIAPCMASASVAKRASTSGAARPDIRSAGARRDRVRAKGRLGSVTPDGKSGAKPRGTAVW